MITDLPAAAQASWRSQVYDHYTTSIQRNYTADDSPHNITYVFTCKSDPVRHKPHMRPRMRTSEGTTNLQNGLATCNERNNISQPAVTRPAHGVAYSTAAHRALLALRCARSSRPSNSVLDEDYRMEVEMLRPGTVIPHPSTISRDINVIYLELSKHVRDYFKVSFLN